MSMFVPRIEIKTHSNCIIRRYNHLNKCVVEGVDQGDDVSDYISEFLRRVHCNDLSRVPRVRLLRFVNRTLINSQKHTAQYAHPQASNYAPFMFTFYDRMLRLCLQCMNAPLMFTKQSSLV